MYKFKYNLSTTFNNINDCIELISDKSGVTRSKLLNIIKNYDEELYTNYIQYLTTEMISYKYSKNIIVVGNTKPYESTLKSLGGKYSKVNAWSFPKEKSNDLQKKLFSLSQTCIARSNLLPKPHQLAVVQHLLHHKAVMAVFGTGSGKTLSAVLASQCLLDKYPDMRVVVVSPTSLIKNMRKELKKYGATKKSIKRYKFYNYESFKTIDEDECNSDTFLIIDEVHNLRNPKSKATEVALECAVNSKKVLLLTATPVYNTPYDSMTMISILKGKEQVPSKKKFAEVWDSTTSEVVDESKFLKLYRDTAIFFDTPVGPDYPKFEEHNIRITMTPEFYKKYLDVAKGKDQTFSKNPETFLTGLREATNALQPCQKCDWVIDKIKEGKKTLVHSPYLEHGIKIIEERLGKLGIKYLEVSGSIDKEERMKIVDTFNNSKDTNVLFISSAGSEGLDLKGVKYVILLNTEWNKPSEEQIRGRAVRFRSHVHLPLKEQRVDIYRLVLVTPKGSDLKSADELVLDYAQNKVYDNERFLYEWKRVNARGENGVNTESCKKPIKIKGYTIHTMDSSKSPPSTMHKAPSQSRIAITASDSKLRKILPEIKEIIMTKFPPLKITNIKVCDTEIKGIILSDVYKKEVLEIIKDT